VFFLGGVEFSPLGGKEKIQVQLMQRTFVKKNVPKDTRFGGKFF
jgi:hypothetical protein